MTKVQNYMELVKVQGESVHLEKERVWFAMSIKDGHNSDVSVFSYVNHVKLHRKPIRDSR